MEKPGFVRMGKITKAHGLKGAVKVHLYTESPELFQERTEILAVRNDGSEEHFTLKWARSESRRHIFALSGVDSRLQAEDLAGADIYIEKSLLPELEEGSYYWSDIIGLAVYDAFGVYLGRVESIIPTGGNDVYVVRDQGKETLIPALDWVVRAIDLDGRMMQVDLPEGYD